LVLLATISTLAKLLNVFVHTASLCLSAPVASAPKAIPGLRAMLTVADSGGQSALLAPTEVLAQQHFSSIRALLGSLAGDGIVSEPGAVTVTLLTGSMSQPAKRQALMEISSGAAGIVIGTHALLQDTVQFADLGLVVVDEQHRFGVEQRARLTGKSADATRPHLLVMTATPIPRTVAMTVFADLDISTLTELPAGRAPITTHVVAASEQPRHLVRVWQRVVEEVGLGRKAYVVCPRIGGEGPSADDSEAQASHGAVELYAQLTSHELAGMRVGLLHGRLPADEKDAVMKRFALPSQSEDALDVLVATTVIEVGVDVPTASVMIVMDADRFGISQLHQLRGRVGRGGLPGLCLLVTDSADESARERLTVVASTTDGFALSEYDLTVRREGDVLGAEQSGRASSLKLLQVLHDQEVVAAAREEAAALIELDSTFEKFPELRDAITLLTQNRA
ncbi:MAG: DEAD/DEAH box helicase, partial [Actinobacteria bacterium]|nr:DEAD/DEAH box helicase [Actinomycetota bacterium]